MSEERQSSWVAGIHVRCSGAQGPAVLLLHGQPGSIADWDRVLPLLSGDHRVVVPDRPGYGSTGGDASGFRSNAEAMIRVLDALSIERIVVAGHSWGGGVAIAMSELYPGRVSGMVLLASVGPGSPARIDDRILAAPVLGDMVTGATFGLAGLLLGSTRIRSLSRHVFPGRSADAVHTLASLTRADARHRTWRSFVVEQRALLGELRDLEPGLAEIAVPTLVLQGDADHQVPQEIARNLTDTIPGATMRVLAGAGHFLTFDRAGAVADAVRDLSGSAGALEGADRPQGGVSPEVPSGGVD